MDHVTAPTRENWLMWHISGIISGVAIHHSLFIHGEWHYRAPTILLFYLSHLTFLVALHLFSYMTDASSTFANGLMCASADHVLSLMASIMIYRRLFHRLGGARFPGPWWAQYTKIWHVWENRGSKNYIYLHGLHQKYGDVVRTGPAEVTVFLPQAHEAVGRHQSTCNKSEFYDLLWPERALFTTRDKAIHAKRRRDWQYGFSPSAMRHHEVKVLKWVDELDRQLQERARKNSVVDATEFFLWFTFDIMGEFTFSKSFNMLENQEWHSFIVQNQNARRLLGSLASTPWLLHVGVKLLPRVLWVKDWCESIEWCEAQMKERLSRGSPAKVPDLVSYLMEDTIDDKACPWLIGDSLLAILGGSEPTAQTLTAIFHELSRHPEHIDKIRHELASIDCRDSKALADMSHMNAVVQETMRLHPNLLTGGSRKTTEKGVVIGNVYIPPHVTIVTPHYTIARREDCFEQGTQFIPERWTTKPEMVRNSAAHIPFSIGQYSCIGKGLAWRIMRLTVARIIQNYDFRLAPGCDGRSMEDDKADRFTAFPGSVPLCFKRRD